MTKLEQLEVTHRKLGEEIQALKEPEFEPFWEPTNNKKSWYVDRVSCRIRDSISWWQNEIKSGMAYKTEELAQKALDYKLAEQRLRKAVWNLNKGPAPEFVTSKHNYTMVVDRGIFYVTYWSNYQVHPDWLWFHTKELAEQLIESHSDDLMIYLRGV